MVDLDRLAELVAERNRAGHAIAGHIGRPATIGHVGEYIAARVFDIGLMASAAHKAIDGHFRSGALAGRSVNVKWYSRNESVLDITPAALPDEYLVLAGPAGTQAKGEDRPWLIASVYLFAANELVRRLQGHGVKIGIATSIRSAEWEAAEIYPRHLNPRLVLTDTQFDQLAPFAG